MPKVGRFCFVSKTLGNRRLGDNGLTGLERLLPFLVNTQDVTKLYNAFPVQRRDTLEQNTVFPTSIEAFTGSFGGLQDFYDFQFGEKVPKEFHNFEKQWLPIWNDSCAVLEN